MIATKHSSTWATPPTLFALVIFEIGPYTQARLDCDPSISAPCHGWDDRHLPLYPVFIDWVEVLRTFFPSWPQIPVLSISTSWIARITSMCHHVQPIICISKKFPGAAGAAGRESHFENNKPTQSRLNNPSSNRISDGCLSCHSMLLSLKWVICYAPMCSVPCTAIRIGCHMEMSVTMTACLHRWWVSQSGRRGELLSTSD
jgi:hypothetical protein